MVAKIIRALIPYMKTTGRIPGLFSLSNPMLTNKVLSRKQFFGLAGKAKKELSAMGKLFKYTEKADYNLKLSSEYFKSPSGVQAKKKHIALIKMLRKSKLSTEERQRVYDKFHLVPDMKRFKEMDDIRTHGLTGDDLEDFWKNIDDYVKTIKGMVPWRTEGATPYLKTGVHEDTLGNVARALASPRSKQSRGLKYFMGEGNFPSSDKLPVEEMQEIFKVIRDKKIGEKPSSIWKGLKDAFEEGLYGK